MTDGVVHSSVHPIPNGPERTLVQKPYFHRCTGAHVLQFTRALPKYVRFLFRTVQWIGFLKCTKVVV